MHEQIGFVSTADGNPGMVCVNLVGDLITVGEYKFTPRQAASLVGFIVAASGRTDAKAAVPLTTADIFSYSEALDECAVDGDRFHACPDCVENTKQSDETWHDRPSMLG
jgi:hypothetical protein